MVDDTIEPLSRIPATSPAPHGDAAPLAGGERINRGRMTGNAGQAYGRQLRHSAAKGFAALARLSAVPIPVAAPAGDSCPRQT